MSANVATDTTDKPQKAAPAKAIETAGFGAYGATANPMGDLTAALDKPPESKVNGSLAFTESDNRWLKELGLTTTQPSEHHKAWETSLETDDRKHRKWSDSYHGRVAMRAVSRGVVGAAFYAAGNMIGSKAMEKYHPDNNPMNPLQRIARFIDETIGEGIQKTTRAVTGSEEKAYNATRFRDTVDYGYMRNNERVYGRSLGHEATMVTFDFASMSFGDYMTRYALGLVDPNAKKHWMKEGHIDVPGGLKDLLSNVFRGVTYAAGEDMAVAIPYVYGMRFQRNLINKSKKGGHPPGEHGNGFKFVSDAGRSDSFVAPGGKVAGDYAPEGILDLVGRFSWYNVGTKIFRDAYSNVEQKVEHFEERWKKGDHSLPKITIDPQKLTVKSISTSVAHGLRYVLRTTIKVMGYMIPASTVFALIRAPQSRTRALAIDPDKGVLGWDKEGTTRPGRSEDANFAGVDFDPATPGVAYRGNPPFEKLTWRSGPGEKGQTGMGSIRSLEEYPFKRKRTQAFENVFYEKSGAKMPWYQSGVNAMARTSYGFGTKVNEFLSAGPLGKVTEKIFGGAIEGPGRRQKFARLYANAAISYTPYFMLKTDVLSAEWDTRRMDMAIDHMLDGAGHLKWGEFRAGGSEVMRALMREPFQDPKREAQAQRERWHADPEHRSNEAYQLSGNSLLEPTQSGATSARKFAKESMKSKSTIPATFTKLKTPESWAAQEAVRKFQDIDNSQGQSVH